MGGPPVNYQELVGDLRAGKETAPAGAAGMIRKTKRKGGYYRTPLFGKARPPGPGKSIKGSFLRIRGPEDDSPFNG